jgi:beta-lactam-binding protein with PASTA domain
MLPAARRWSVWAPRRRLAAALLAATGLVALNACQSSHRSAFSPPKLVTVPERAAHTDIVDASDLLHRLGLRVELTKQIAISSLAVPGVELSPVAGTRLPRGSAVTIAPGFGALGSPGVSTSRPHYRVPNFDGQLLDVAVTWTNQHAMYWSVPALPALPASDAPHLFDAYRIIHQTPEPGQTIVQGVARGHAFRVTPLTLKVVLA